VQQGIPSVAFERHAATRAKLPQYKRNEPFDQLPERLKLLPNAVDSDNQRIMLITYY